MIASERVLDIFIQLLTQPTLQKSVLMERYHTSASSIQRDLQTIRRLLDDRADHRIEDPIQQVSKGVYSLHPDLFGTLGLTDLASLSDVERVAIAQVLLASRGFTKEEMQELVTSLVGKKNQYQELIRNSLFLYQDYFSEPILAKLQVISQAIESGNFVEFDYTKNFETRHFVKKPLAIYFSDLYFYLATAHHASEDDIDLSQLNKFRINNLRNLVVNEDLYEPIDYAHRPQPGALAQVTGPFSFYGQPIDLEIEFYYDPVYVLDRFPESRIVPEHSTKGSTRIRIQTNDGYGLKMWLLMQGKQLKVLKPASIRDYLLEEIHQMQEIYSEKNTN